MSHLKNISDYYDQTLNHYQNWWRLDRNLSVHYGIWDNNTRNFQDSLQNTNRYLANIAEIKQGEKILDAGCGVGGSAFFLHDNFNNHVEGITLSEKQYEYAKSIKIKRKIHNINFSIQDYCNTNFNSESFDVIWAIESITSAPDKQKFAREANRLLKKGGRLIIADYFKVADIEDINNLLEKWRNLWSMAPFMNTTQYIKIFEKSGLINKSTIDVTVMIEPTARRMYYSYLFGGPLARLYNLVNSPSPWAKKHYLSGLYQYKSLKKGLWTYQILRFDKL